jgi:hypothetical protein
MPHILTASLSLRFLADEVEKRSRAAEAVVAFYERGMSRINFACAGGLNHNSLTQTD